MMPNFTLILAWGDGSVTQIGFATRVLAMAAHSDIRNTDVIGSRVVAALIVQNTTEVVDLDKRRGK